MNNMTRGEISYLGHQFDDFLYASVGMESNGMELSVLSVLARQNVDPWHEAKQLAELSEKTAAQRLAPLIPLLPNTLSRDADRKMIALRLVALLRQHPTTETPVNNMSSDMLAIQGFSALVLLAVFILFALGSHGAAVSLLPSVKTENTATPPSPHNLQSSSQSAQ